MKNVASVQHVISTQQFFERDILEKLFAVATDMKEHPHGRHSLDGRILANLFYEPSTRTRFSFEAAMQRLGGSTISTEAAAHFSSVSKGETLEDTIKVVGGYADAIVLRHPEIGSAERAAAVSTVPVINAGDGGGEHPTQALLDIFTIRDECGKIDGLKIALIGDLRNGRTIHSLLFLLGLFQDIELTLVAPELLRLPNRYLEYLKESGITYRAIENLNQLATDTDVLYVTRVQKERFEDAAEYDRLKHFYVIDETVLAKLKPAARILHPLPRVGEISPAVDADPRAAYFRQAENGLYVRMALLEHLLS